MGSTVDVRHGGQLNWFEARVGAVHEQGGAYVYEIAYADGDKEEAVPRYRIKRAGDVQAEVLVSQKGIGMLSPLLCDDSFLLLLRWKVKQSMLATAGATQRTQAK